MNLRKYLIELLLHFTVTDRGLAGSGLLNLLKIPVIILYYSLNRKSSPGGLLKKNGSSAAVDASKMPTAASFVHIPEENKA